MSQEEFRPHVAELFLSYVHDDPGLVTEVSDLDSAISISRPAVLWDSLLGVGLLSGGGTSVP